VTSLARLVDRTWVHEVILSSPLTPPSAVYDAPSFALTSEGAPAVALQHHLVAPGQPVMFNLLFARSR